MGFGGIGGGLKNLGGGNTTGFQNNSNQSNIFTNQNSTFGTNTMTTNNNLNHNANDQSMKKQGFTINRDLTNMHTDTIQDMTFLELGNNNYKLVSVGWDKSIRLWNCQVQKNNSYSMGIGMSSSNNSPKAFCSISFAQKIDLKVYGLKVKHIPQMNSVLIVCGDCTIRQLNLALSLIHI